MVHVSAQAEFEEKDKTFVSMICGNAPELLSDSEPSLLDLVTEFTLCALMP